MSLGDCAATHDLPMISKLMIMDFFRHCFDELSRVGLLHRLGMCADCIIGHIQCNSTEGVRVDGIELTIVQLMYFVKACYHFLTYCHLGGNFVGR
jgi:hypothetical protein